MLDEPRPKILGTIPVDKDKNKPLKSSFLITNDQ